MTFNTYGDKGNPSLLLIPGLGVSYEIFLPLIDILKDRYQIVAAGIDGFLLGKESAFTSVDDEAGQIIRYIKGNLNGCLNVAYGLSLGGKRNEIAIGHAILDAAPLLPLPKWSVDPLRYYQSAVRIGLPEQAVEKDLWVTTMLQVVFSMPYKLQNYC